MDSLQTFVHEKYGRRFMVKFNVMERKFKKKSWAIYCVMFGHATGKVLWSCGVFIVNREFLVPC